MSRGVVALIVEVVFFSLAFGLRSIVQWRRTGSSGFIRPRRGAPAIELVGSGLFVLSIVLLIVGPVADLAGATRFFDSVAIAALGLVLALVGVGLTLWAQVSMGDSWRIGVDQSATTDLVTTGVFALVRNPIFTAMVLAATGLALLIPNVWSVAAVVTLVLGLQVQVRRVEEPYLRRTQGRAYDLYLAAVGRFVPRVGAVRQTG